LIDYSFVAAETLDMSASYYSAGITAAELEPKHTALVQRFADRTYPGVNYALADVYADEVKVRIEHILGLARKNLADAGRP
jgi:hypothetical protein